MSGATKMIILTSNEDIIQKLQLNQNSASSANNFNGDQIFKRSLDSSDQQKTKATKTPRRSNEFVCTICGDRAIGFNYDVLSCASCKAFFRRNAFQDLNKLRCLKGDGSCSVEYDIRRKCQRCRLQRCFAMRMRKDRILNVEQKQQRKQRLEENRHETSKRSSNASSVNDQSIVPTSNEIDQLLMDIESLNEDLLSEGNSHLIQSETLSEEDCSIIQYVQTSFLHIFDFPSSSCTSYIDLSNRSSALISWSEFVSQAALRFIDYFRQIKEFENLIADDRYILIKYNLLIIFTISKTFNYQKTCDCCSHDSSEQAEKHRQFFLLCGIPISVRNGFIELISSLVRLTKQDPKILSLLLNIFMFSPCLSMSENEPPLKDPLSVQQGQSYYTKLLWNYLINKFGENQSQLFFIELMSIILKLQTATKSFRDVFRDQYQSIDDIDKIAPLMQSVLHIS